MARPTAAIARAEAALRAYALAKPEATEHFPWGDRAIKVKGKVFIFMSVGATTLSMSTKLPASGEVALLLPFAEPTGYGLGKSGWVSASFEPGEQPPIEVLCAWIDESYQAVAPAKLAAAARAGDGAPGDEPAARRTAARRPAAKRPAAKHPAAKRTAPKRTAAKRTAPKRTAPKRTAPKR